MSQEKTERATPKKRQDSRKKGQVAKSMEIPSALVLLMGFLSLFLLSSFIGSRVYNLYTLPFHEFMHWDLTVSNTLMIYQELFTQGIMILAPIFIVTVVMAIVGNYVQFGFLFSGEPLKMKLSKLNPIEGVKRIFSLRALVEFAKSSLKMLIIGVIVVLILWTNRIQIISLSFLPLEGIFGFVSNLTMMICLSIGLLLVVLSIFDYMYQRYDYEKNLRMSKQDVKDEFKKTEGDPLIKSRMKEKQRAMAMQRMMQEVPKADVVITNPTHYAVALQYDADRMEAPTVIAKGKGFIALKIREKAEAADIIIMENKPLARALFANAEIGETVPEDLFQAVAEIFAYVYNIKNQAAARR